MDKDSLEEGKALAAGLLIKLFQFIKLAVVPIFAAAIFIQFNDRLDPPYKTIGTILFTVAVIAYLGWGVLVQKKP